MRTGVNKCTTLRRQATILVLLLLCTLCPVKAQINTDNVLLMGRSAIGADDYLTAIHYFNQVIQAKPFLNVPYYYRAYAKFSLDDYTGAEEDCTKSIDINPYIVEVYQLRGLCRIHNEDYEGAVSDYTRALSELPEDQGTRYNRGLCNLRLKHYDEAEADMDYILGRWPHFYRAYLVKTQICLEKKDTLRGMACIDQLLNVTKDNADAWSLKGHYALQKEKYAEADSCLTRALELRPTAFDDYLGRALARHGQNRFGEAISDYDRVIELVPQHFVAHYNRGLLRALVGENNRAIDDFTFVIKQEPDNVLAIYNRALLRRDIADYRGAIADFSRLIRLYPNFTYGYWARAECRRKIGDVSGALKDESVVARANLDVTFGKRSRRHPIKKVRRRSDHSLDNYQQLVDAEENDSTGSIVGRMLSGDLFGKIQNKKTDSRPMPPFAFTLHASQSNEKGYHSKGFLPEMEKLASRTGKASLRYTTDRTAESSSDRRFGKLGGLSKGISKTDSLFLASVENADNYNYATALSNIEGIEGAKPSKAMQLLLRLQKASVLFKTHMTESRALLSGNKERANGKEHIGEETPQGALQIALKELSEAQKSAGNSAYILYNLGCIYGELGDGKTAANYYTQAIAADDRLAEAYLNRGLIFLSDGETAKAKADLSRAGELGLYKAYAILKQAK